MVEVLEESLFLILLLLLVEHGLQFFNDILLPDLIFVHLLYFLIEIFIQCDLCIHLGEGCIQFR